MPYDVTQSVMAKRHYLFVGILWLAILNALVSAVLPAGLPLSTPIGSAFNPATTLVSTIARAKPLAERKAEALPDEPAQPAMFLSSTMQNWPLLIIPVQVSVISLCVAVLRIRVFSGTALLNLPFLNRPVQAMSRAPPPRDLQGAS